MSSILQNLVAQHGASTTIVPSGADERPSWLDTFTREKRKFLRPRADIQPPFPSTDVEFEDQCCERVEYDVRVYQPTGHSVRIVLTEAYARSLDESRMEYPWLVRARPEDFVPHLEELPDSSYIRELVLLDWENAFDPWLISQGGNRSLAAATKHGDIEFYRAELNGWLGINVKHEWCHLADARFPECFPDFRNAMNSEWYEWLPDQNALKSGGEHFALLGQVLMHREGEKFLECALNAPMRTVAFFEVFERSLDASQRPSAFAAVWRKRIEVVRSEILPIAVRKAADRVKLATELHGFLTRAEAANAGAK